MKSLSQKLRELFGRLYDPWDEPASRLTEREKVERLKEIGELCEPAAIPALLGFVYRGEDAVADLAASTIQQIVDGCEPLVLAQLGGAVRDV